MQRVFLTHPENLCKAVLHGFCLLPVQRYSQSVIAEDENPKVIQRLIEKLSQNRPKFDRSQRVEEGLVYAELQEALRVAPNIPPPYIGKLCNLLAINNIADKALLDILQAHICQQASQLSHIEVYQVLRFMVEMGVCEARAFSLTKERLMQVYTKMDFSGLSHAVKAVAFFEKTNADEGALRSLFSYLVRIWPKRRVRVTDVVNIATAARECSYSDKRLAQAILKATLVMHSKEKLKSYHAHTIHNALKAVGFYSKELEDVMLYSSMKGKGIVIFG
ncbi:NACHT LRR and PYD domains-containing protein 12-like protein [Perkinsela sp. CCAP 1560/4]|nr:NACHT LRR and PYD domains-containing protein 12-like protein [Perkinsela sp. CCAP 1560/4]|eukprot:KNH06638.1 NACHT LRR and PYD domains-containing protein 12-like protein [Perkinsela sp. CCAP 1560/4]